MNFAIFLNTIRERLTNRVRIGFLTLLVTVEIVKNIGANELPSPSTTTLYGLVLGGTIISGDVASGVLHLVWSRPVARASYCLAKWAALTATTFAVSVIGLAVALAAGGGVPLAAGAVAVAERLASAAGVAAVLVLFSAVLPRLGDVALWGSLALIVVNVEQWLKPDRFPVTCYAASAVGSLLWPETVFANSPPIQASLVYASTVVGALALASVALARREVSYAD